MFSGMPKRQTKKAGRSANPGRIKKALKGARNRAGLELEGIQKRTPEAVRAAQLRHNKSLKKEKDKQQVNKRNAKALQGHRDRSADSSAGNEAGTISVDEPLTKVGTTVVGVRETAAGGSNAKPPPKAMQKINEQRKVKEAKEKRKQEAKKRAEKLAEKEARKAGKKAREAEAKKKAEKLADKEAKEAEDALANLAVKEAAEIVEKEAAEKAEKEA